MKPSLADRASNPKRLVGGVFRPLMRSARAKRNLCFGFRTRLLNAGILKDRFLRI